MVARLNHKRYYQGSMSRNTKRHVKRQPNARQTIVGSVDRRAWYQLPGWAKDWFVQNSGWVVAILAMLLAPAAILALVLGARSLPLEFIGVPSTDAGLGLAALAFVTKFVFTVLAVRPLFRQERRGWYWLMAAASVHLAHGVLLRHAISSGFLLLLVIYLYFQVRNRYQK
jgi:hypothetical protein